MEQREKRRGRPAFVPGQAHESQREIMLKDGYLTAQEAARRIGVNTTTIYRLISSGKVRTSKVGQLVYLEAHSLAEHYKEAPPLVRRILEGVEAKPGGNGARSK